MGKKIIKNMYVVYGLLFLLILVLRIPALYHTIIDIDEAAFAEFANKWINGAVPYAGVYDNKPVLTYFFYYLVFFVFGINNLFAVHVATIIYVFVTSVILYRFTLRNNGQNEAIASTLFFIFLMHTYEPKYIATNTETLFTLPLLLSFIGYHTVIFTKKNHNFYLLLSGLCSGISLLFNYKAGIILAVFAVFGLYGIITAEDKKHEFIQQIRYGLLLLAGTIVPLFIACVYFYYKGALTHFIELGFLYNFKYIQSGIVSVPVIKALARFGWFVICGLPLWIIIIKYFGTAYRQNYYKHYVVLLAVWLAASCFAALLGWRAYGHYFIQIALPLSLFAGSLISYVKPAKLKRINVYFAVTMVLFSISRINIPYTYALLGDSNLLSDGAYRKVAKKVIEITSPEDTMFVWGSGASAYIYANRRCSSKIIITDYVSGRQFGVTNEDMGQNVNKYIQFLRNEFIDEFQKHPPVIFIDTSPSGYFGYNKFPLETFPALNTIINNEYIFIESIEKMNIFVLKQYVKKINQLNK